MTDREYLDALKARADEIRSEIRSQSVRYVATVNTPGYMPESEPETFDSASEAWAYLAEERRQLEDGWDAYEGQPYSETYDRLTANAGNGWGEDTVTGPSEMDPTPFDLSIAYTVTEDTA